MHVTQTDANTLEPPLTNYDEITYGEQMRGFGVPSAATVSLILWSAPTHFPVPASNSPVIEGQTE